MGRSDGQKVISLSAHRILVTLAIPHLDLGKPQYPVNFLWLGFTPGHGDLIRLESHNHRTMKVGEDLRDPQPTPLRPLTVSHVPHLHGS